ncbi:girdin-like [Phymastichus coffea]|uniref:girdin-like n=1 Tax=Phymastichus coffea TaxID=108790 RepID=UPI00273B5A58|nr:girdin-like [Phymastichus coffea]
MNRIRYFYEDQLGEVILRLPQIDLIAKEPRLNAREVELLLVLLLGCSIKCPNKKYFVDKITQLDEETQAALASYVSKVLQVPNIILNKEMLTFESVPNEQQLSYHKEKIDKAIEIVSKMSKEKNELLEQLRTISSKRGVKSYENELNEWRAETVALIDRVHDYKCKLTLMEAENRRLASEVISYRDTLENMSELTQQQDQSKQEINNYRVELKKMSSYKMRFEDSEQYNQALKEKNDELARQFKSYKEETDKSFQHMMRKISRWEKKCRGLEIENEAICKHNSKLCEENADLERHIKMLSTMNASLDSSFNVEADESFNPRCNSSLCEELAQSIKLDLENRHLSTVNEDSILENSLQIKYNELEEENNSLQSMVDDQKYTISYLQKLLSMTRTENTKLKELLRDIDRQKQDLKSKITMVEYEDKSSKPSERKLVEIFPDYKTQENVILEKQLQETLSKLIDCNKANSADRQKYIYLKHRCNIVLNEHSIAESNINTLSKYHQDFQATLQENNLKIIEIQKKNNLLQVELENSKDLIKRLESDRERLNRLVSNTLENNHNLITQSLSRQQDYQNNVKQKDKDLDKLIQVKTKLEEKIMSQYQQMDNKQEPKKRNVLGCF